MPTAFYAFAASFVLCWIVLCVLKKTSVLALKNARSNHEQPTPVGGGIGFISLIILLFLLSDVTSLNFTIAVSILMLVSFIDDVKSVSPIIRFSVQILAVIFALTQFPIPINNLFPALPDSLSYILAGLGLLWFINLFNFMDGVDGLAISEGICIALGLIVIGYVKDDRTLYVPGEIFAICAAGFVPFNFPFIRRAAIFMGDAGSISIGFILGFLLLTLAIKSNLGAALILPAYFVLDASVTMITKIKAGIKPWQPHSRHAYQIAARSGMTHRRITLQIIALNCILIVLAVIAVKIPVLEWPAAIAAYALCWLMMKYFKKD